VTVQTLAEPRCADPGRRCLRRRGQRRSGRKHAFARSGFCQDRRRAVEPAKPQVTSGAEPGSVGCIVGSLSYYDPSTASFLTRDPIVGVTREAYGYTGGSPLNATDPSGLDWSCLTNRGSCDLPIPDAIEEALGSETAHNIRTAAFVVLAIDATVVCVALWMGCIAGIGLTTAGAPVLTGAYFTVKVGVDYIRTGTCDPDDIDRIGVSLEGQGIGPGVDPHLPPSLEPSVGQNEMGPPSFVPLPGTRTPPGGRGNPSIRPGGVRR